MELDTATLRVAFGIVAFTMLTLFYFVTFRSTRSAYSLWWCAGLVWFLVGSAAYLLNGTAQQHWANPLGNVLLVLGAVCAWGGARSLSGGSTPWWQIAAAPTVAGAVAFADDPGKDIWAGGTIFLATMCLMFGLSARELWRIDRRDTQIRTSVAAAATLICAYYLGRCVVFVLEGPDSQVFSRFFGSQMTTIVALVFLIAISFSMSVLSNEQITKDLQIRATHDGLTGLLNRAEFLRLAAVEMRLMRRTGTSSAALVLADLDNFKQVNDTYGHPEGDRTLQAFARAATGAVRSADLVGRYGGEEFILLLPRTSLDRAEQVTGRISAMLRAAGRDLEHPMPTVSYGVVLTDPRASLDVTIAAADAALYRAKTLGRDRVVRFDGQPDPDASGTVRPRRSG